MYHAVVLAVQHNSSMVIYGDALMNRCLRMYSQYTVLLRQLILGLSQASTTPLYVSNGNHCR